MLIDLGWLKENDQVTSHPEGAIACSKEFRYNQGIAEGQREHARTHISLRRFPRMSAPHTTPRIKTSSCRRVRGHKRGTRAHAHAHTHTSRERGGERKVERHIFEACPAPMPRCRAISDCIGHVLQPESKRRTTHTHTHTHTHGGNQVTGLRSLSRANTTPGKAMSATV